MAIKSAPIFNLFFALCRSNGGASEIGRPIATGSGRCKPSVMTSSAGSNGALIATISERLRQREPVSDDVFDSVMAELPKSKSRSFWSSVEAAQLASKLFRQAGARRVLDTGSGAGKFCTIASLDLGCTLWGIERRAELVAESRRLSEVFGAQTIVTEGTLESVEPQQFDGFYFYNPFGEYLADDVDRYDSLAPRSFDAYIKEVRLVERWLRSAKLGTAVVTYNGLGGRIPASYRVRHTSHVRDDVMRLWVKEKADTTWDAFVEIEEQLLTASELAEVGQGNSATFPDSSLLRELSLSREDISG